MAKDKLFPVGKYQSLYNTLLNLNLPCNDIFRSAGLSKHILKRHPECAAYIDNIPEILSNPDYIGTNPREKNSIEFIKCYSENILVAVKLDLQKDYYYVASVYDITNSKLTRRIKSNRCIKFTIDNI